jgi:hypothetical protein
VEITIGVQNVPRELIIETDATAEAMTKQIRKALDAGTVIEIADSRGRQVLIPVANVGYVEIGDETRRVGFHTV